MPDTKTETLAEYVTRIISEKGLKQQEVKESCGGAITDGYVRGIMTGKASNPSVKKLQALARGLGVSEDEVFKVARGLAVEGKGKSQKEESSYRTIATVMIASLKSSILMELLSEVVKLSPDSRQEAISMLKFLNGRKKRSTRPRTKR